MLPDVLDHGLRLVICGTAAGEESAARGAYYAHPTNKFWKTLHQVGLTPRRLSPEEFPRLVDYGIGLTDLVKGVAGRDSLLRRSDFDCAGFEDRIRKYQPQVVCFNGKKAAEEYFGRKGIRNGLQPKSPIDGVRFYVAPSTSGGNGYWDLESWQALAEMVGTESRMPG